MKEEILQLITNNHKASNGKCGLSVCFLMNKFSLKKAVLQDILKELFDEKIISIRTGINGYLVFKN